MNGTEIDFDTMYIICSAKSTNGIIQKTINILKPFHLYT